MFWRYLITIAIQLCWITFGASELTIVRLLPRTTASIANHRQTIPWVGDGPDYFQGYGAKVLGSVSLLSVFQNDFLR
jgi:hypothetical protein